ncbi:MAG: hypothetical protein IT184_16420 [Acidobacteria bacterium]|nr:hypothetical protein [Acidobacteriota bacterium]
MKDRRFRRAGSAALALVLLVPSAAAAQWYAAGYLGASHTQSSTVSIRLPDDGIALDFHDVRFYSLSTQPRRYYGLRIGRSGWPHRRLGLELEMIHMKAYADTTRDYAVTSSGPSLALLDTSPMNGFVQEFAMSHGLNFALVNLVVRRPLGGDDARAAVTIRAGGGPIFPHAETTVGGRTVHEYQYAGVGTQAAAGLELRLGYRTSAIAEYKLTYCRPELEMAAGLGATTAISHHVSLGLMLALSPAVR